MSSKNLVICDTETAYASRLAAFINGKREFAFQVKICSDSSQIPAMQKERKIDVLLLSEDCKDSKGGEITEIPWIIRLTSEQLAGERDKPFIFKYQSGEEICTKLMQICAEGEKEGFLKIRKKGKGRIIGFYSPVKRAGQTTLALKKGRELSGKENVLYINMETFAGMDGYFPAEQKQNLSVLLYYAKQENGNPGMVLTTLVRQISGVDYIPPAAFPEDIRSVEPEEWLWLFSEILNYSLYDVLILDIGDGVQGLCKILQACDEIYMTAADDRAAASKIRQYEEMLIRAGYGEVLERVVKCDVRRRAAGKDFRTARPVKRN